MISTLFLIITVFNLRLSDHKCRMKEAEVGVYLYH